MIRQRTLCQSLGWLVLLVVFLTGCTINSPREDVRAGLRASSYGISPFPDTAWWEASSGDMAAGFDVATPAVVWIVGVMAHPQHCWLSFPVPEDLEIKPEYVVFSATDANEAYLDHFDAVGVQVWLQVESSGADVPTLIDLLLSRYGHHSSVVGVGLDVEWHKNRDYAEGKAVSDAEARSWVEQIRSYNPEYRLFLKHWLTEKMPPSYREGVMFLNDSQGFDSFEAMLAEFSDWGVHFSPAAVGFQYGYASDRTWWQALDNPPALIGNRLLSTIPNTRDLYWVDFTAEEIWPLADRE